MTKYIFDFDDVLFFNTKKFKKHMYQCFEGVGVSSDTAKKYYEKERAKEFTMRNLVNSVLKGENISSIVQNELVEDIMKECKNCINEELIERIKILGKENCYIVTHGVAEYQLEKIQRTGIESLFSNISIVQGAKKLSVEAICEQFKNEEVVFIDDKEERFSDLNFKKYPNLRTVLYVGQESFTEIF